MAAHNEGVKNGADAKSSPAPAAPAPAAGVKKVDGFDPAMFVTAPPDHFLCGICTNVCRDMCETSCGHLFCRACISEWLSTGHPICPEDRKPLTIDACRPCVRDNRTIQSLIVKCTNGGVCKEQMELRALDDHLTLKCAERPVVCAICSVKMFQSESKLHSESSTVQHIAALASENSLLKFECKRLNDLYAALQTDFNALRADVTRISAAQAQAQAAAPKPLVPVPIAAASFAAAGGGPVDLKSGGYALGNKLNGLDGGALQAAITEIVQSRDDPKIHWVVTRLEARFGRDSLVPYKGDLADWIEAAIKQKGSGAALAAVSAAAAPAMSVAAVAALIPEFVFVGNTHKAVGGHNHEWTVFVSSVQNQIAPASSFIETVKVILDESFNPRIILLPPDKCMFRSCPLQQLSGTDNRFADRFGGWLDGCFQLTRVGWGSFDVELIVTFKPFVAHPPAKFVHTLVFTAPFTSIGYKLAQLK